MTRNGIPRTICCTLLVVLTLVNAPAEAQSSRSRRDRRTDTASSRGTSDAAAGDWNQFRGPNRDNICTETGLLDSWPPTGPQLVQTINGLGEGYSSVALVGDLIYTMGNVADGEYVMALSRSTGEIVWKFRNGDAYRENMGNGPRATPTVVDGLVYSLGANGDLSCLKADSGELIWKGNVL
ncbi:MAG: PQQ-binding-like beta-propeller repeat protein, partial [Planctomycetaceae bacterium]|nr:PQQ-binding-like beta-propeller repeat protein [Planctomycetaceae bacterium]